MTSSRRELALVTVRSVHTLVWLIVEAAMVYVLVAGARGRNDRRASIAATLVGVESAVFLGNGARCPLTGLAERLGVEHGSVTDIFLPRALARSLPAIHVPPVVLAVVLHSRNLRSNSTGRYSRRRARRGDRW